jgi:hypothetical protein
MLFLGGSFSSKSFNLRLGYNFRRTEELQFWFNRNFSGVSLGFGLKFNKLKFDYSTQDIL